MPTTILSASIPLLETAPAIHPARVTTPYLIGTNLELVFETPLKEPVLIVAGTYLRTLDGLLICTHAEEGLYTFIDAPDADEPHYGASAHAFEAWLTLPEVKAWQQPAPT